MLTIDNELVQVLNKHITDLGSALKEATDRAQNSEKIIPIIGMQGVGKSTLINSLIGEFILPAEADETTCIPVEVKYGSPKAEVFKGDCDSPLDVVNDKDGLEQYVDNNCNPGNEKGISRIVLYREAELLKDGLTIVDLPGVGSLTVENQKTTERYLENCCAAVFVIHTIPTITRMESAFIKGHLAFFGNAIFVQNDMGETQDELYDSTAFNKDVLNKISSEVNYKWNQEILIVNAYNALEGAINNDLDEIRDSNVDTLKSRINTFASDWTNANNAQMSFRIENDILKVIEVINGKLGAIENGVEAERKVRTDSFNEYNRQTDEISAIVGEIKDILSRKSVEFASLSAEKTDAFVNTLQSEMEQIIDNGVYDGNNLKVAFKDKQEEIFPMLSNEVLQFLSDTKIEIDDKLSDIENIEIKESESRALKTVGSSSEARWERGVSKLLRLGGATGGILATLALGGPIGWIVGAGIGIISFLFGGWIRRSVEARRKREAKQQMAPLYPDIKKALVADFASKFKEFENNVIKVADDVIEKRNIESARLRDFIDEVSADPKDKSMLEDDLRYLQNVLKEL